MIPASQNPFRSTRIEALSFRPQGTSWEDLLVRLKLSNYRAAIIGPEGSGKTRLLESLAEPLARSGFEPYFFSAKAVHAKCPLAYIERLFRSLSDRHVLLLDGAEQLGWASWLWCKWRSCSLGGLVITAHLAGHLPTLYRSTTNCALLRDLIVELAGEEDHGILTQAEHLFVQHRGNIRLALLDLYDTAAESKIALPPTAIKSH